MTTLSTKRSRGIRRKYTEEHYAVNRGRRGSPAQIRDAVRGNAAAADASERLASHLAANGVTLNADLLTLGVAPAFDPVRERFVDSPGADALLTRQYRRGFEIREIT